MTFQAYIDNVQAKTGKLPADFHEAAIAAGVMTPDLTATRFIKWMNEEFDLGRGHTMAIWAVFQSKGWVPGSKSNKGNRKQC